MIVEAINEIQTKTATGWIEGQYVWMSPTIKDMPTGWKKVDMTKGFTLIAGNSAEKSFTGEIKSHSHNLNRFEFNNLGFRVPNGNWGGLVHLIQCNSDNDPNGHLYGVEDAQHNKNYGFALNFNGQATTTTEVLIT